MVNSICILNGPNLNLLGSREPQTYGHTSLGDVEAACARLGETLGVKVNCTQANGEGALVDAIHAARGVHLGIVLNAGAYTHTSIALRDAIAGVGLPCIEVHISNVHSRESFRHVSMLAPVCLGVMAGFGVRGYEYAVRAMVDHLGLGAG